MVSGRSRCGPRFYRFQSLGSFYSTLMFPMEDGKGQNSGTFWATAQCLIEVGPALRG